MSVEFKAETRLRGWLIVAAIVSIGAGMWGMWGWPSASMGTGALVILGLLFGVKR
jgi:hypothetical protein